MEDADTKRILCVDFAAGSHHDFNLYKKSNLKIYPEIKQKVDKGYIGILKLHENTAIPFKNTKLHPLTKEQKNITDNWQNKEYQSNILTENLKFSNSCNNLIVVIVDLISEQH